MAEIKIENLSVRPAWFDILNIRVEELTIPKGRDTNRALFLFRARRFRGLAETLELYEGFSDRGRAKMSGEVT